MKQISIAVLVGLLLTGCNPSQPFLDTGGVTNISVRYPKGGSVISDTARHSISWGVEDAYRLQLGAWAWLDPRQAIVLCVICYQGDRSIRYCD